VAVDRHRVPAERDPLGEIAVEIVLEHRRARLAQAVGVEDRRPGCRACRRRPARRPPRRTLRRSRCRPARSRRGPGSCRRASRWRCRPRPRGPGRASRSRCGPTASSAWGGLEGRVDAPQRVQVLADGARFLERGPEDRGAVALGEDELVDVARLGFFGSNRISWK
jgi:hypothetical protein